MKKVMKRLCMLLMLVSVLWFVGTGESQVLAAESNAFFTEELKGITITSNMEVPSPATQEKDDYIFAGYYAEPECETPVTATTDQTVYAKFVPSNILSVKAQLRAGTENNSANTNLRLVSSVDSLNYKTVGFEVYYNGATTPIIVKTSTVYERIVASAESGVDCNYSPKVVGTESEYFVTATLLNINKANFGKGFYVKPYWKTLDGTTVYGEGKYITVNNGIDANNINVPVKVNAALNVDSLTVTVAGTEYPATVAFYDGTYAYLNITVENRDSVLKSLSAITVTDGTTSGTAEYRNLMTKYTGTADTSWYDVDTDATEFVIATSADLYGMAQLINQYKNQVHFEGKTIYVISDIVVNTGNAEDWSTQTPDYLWFPMGRQDANGTRSFKGTFDAQMHTISGIYDNQKTVQSIISNSNSSKFGGLFGHVSGATIQNLYLTNSYFYTENTYCGSIMGYATAGVTLNNLYSDSIVYGTSRYVGGLLGYVSTNFSISNCWFDGNVTSARSGGDNIVGGLVGQVGTAGSDYTISNCLNTGTVTASPTSGTSVRAGGLIGYVTGNVDLQYSLNVGMVKYTSGSSKYGSVVGEVAGTVTATGVYTLKECCGGTEGVDNDNIVVINKANMMGATAVSNLTDFNFENWATVPANVAVPKVFESMVYDTSWYDEDKNEFVLYDKADLLGFAELSQTNNFAGKVIKLGADIVVNKGTASEWASTMPIYNWIAIGNSNNKFAGTFDGGLHTIQGLYLKTTSRYTGLFSVIGDGAAVQNLKLKNSYFESSKEDLGSIVGGCFGTSIIDTVYSDATVTGSNSRTGGMIGGGFGNTTVQYCWYAGTVTNPTTGYRYTGGILGAIYDSNSATLKNCLNTGTVDVTAYTSGVVYAGGIVGEAKIKSTVNMSNNLMLGKLLVNEDKATGQYGLIIGYVEGTQNNSNNYVVTPEEWSDTVLSKAYGNTRYYAVNRADILGDNAIITLPAHDFTTIWATVTDDTPVLRFLGTDDETKDTRWYNASAPEYVLYNKDDLYGFAELSQTNDFAGKTIKLGADIVVNTGSADNWMATKPNDSWLPIGNKTTKFAGTFDGDLHTIQGLYLKTTSQYAGLFGITNDGAIIRNLKLKNSYFESTGMDLGSIVGACAGTNLIDTVFSDAIVSGSNARIGGLIGGGHGKTTVQYCCYEGTVTNTSTTNRYTGGILGCLYDGCSAVITDCLNAGVVDVRAYTNNSTSILAGGIVGGTKNSTTNIRIANCLMVGKVLVNEEAMPKNFSLLTGYYSGSKTLNNNYAVIPSEWTEEIQNAAYGTKPTEVNKSDITGNNAKATLTGFDFYNVWSVRENDTPILIMKSESRDEYIVHDAGELIEIAAMSQTTNFAGKTIKLANNIDLTGYTWTPIGGDDSTKRFAGTFDGQGNTIGGISVNATSNYTGLFAATATSAQIKNLILKDSQFVSTVDYVGAVVGYALGGTFSNIRVENVEISGRGRLGGLIGSNGNASTTDTITINNCSFDGTITSPGTEKDYRYIGGLVGYITGNMSLRMSNCMNSGTISAINNVGSDNPGIGGLVGCLMNIKSYEINSCLNTGTLEVNGIATGMKTGYGPIIGRITTDTPLEKAESANNYTVSTCLNADTIAGVISVDENAIKENAEAALPGLDFVTHWIAEADNFPQVRFATTGYVTVESIEVDATTLTSLTALYPETRLLKQGDIHAHANTDGDPDNGAIDGKVDLATWKTQMTTLDMDFAASLDHQSTLHINHQDWDQDLFIYGSEIGVAVRDASLGNEIVSGVHQNVYFTNEDDFENVLTSNTFKEAFDYLSSYSDDKYYNGGNFKCGALYTHTWKEFIQTVQNNNGFYVLAHPNLDPSYITVDNWETELKPYLVDGMGIEVMYKGLGTGNVKQCYQLWKTALNAGYKVYATAGTDTHTDLQTSLPDSGLLEALTSFYAAKQAGETYMSEAYVRYLREGNFTAGSVGLQMCVGSTQMGGTGSFEDAYLEIGIGALHKSVYDSTHKYRVDVWSEDGIMYSQPFTATTEEGQMTYLRTKADSNCKYYRVEIYDVTTNTRIALGNPIWNNAEDTTAE